MLGPAKIPPSHLRSRDRAPAVNLGRARSDSGYSDVDAADDPSSYVARLDAVAATDFWRSVKRRTFALMRPHAGDRVLDVGCGPGDDVRALAEMVQPDGVAMGVDASETMVNEARLRSSGSALSVQFHHASADALPFSDADFDACRIERVLQHVAEPERVLDEMVRVARPGARLVAVEPDYGTLGILGAEPSLTRAIVASRVAHFASGRIGRDLRRLFADRGLAESGLTVAPLMSTDWTQDEASGLLRKYAADAESGGYVSSAQAADWLNQLRSSAASNRYRHTLMVYIVAAVKR